MGRGAFCKSGALAGFLIIKPKRHVKQLAELSTEEFASFPDVLRKTIVSLSRVLQPEKTYVCSFGESVKHVHWYVIPRSADMPASGLDVLQQMFEGRWACSDDEAAEVAANVRTEMSRLTEGSP